MAKGIQSKQIQNVRHALPFTFLNNGAVLNTGPQSATYLELPFDCKIIAVRMYGAPSGSIVVDLWNDSYCVDVETECLTKRGWKKWDEIERSDMLLAFSAERNATLWEKALDFYVDTSYEGKMVQVGQPGSRIEALVTPNHGWPVIPIVGRDEHRLPIRRVKTVDFPAKGLLLRSAPHIPSEIGKYNDALVRLAAWYFTEGSSRPGGQIISISQSEKINPNNCKRIRSDLVLLGARQSNGEVHVGKQKRKGTRGGTLRRVGLWVNENRCPDEVVQFCLSGTAVDCITALFETGANKVPRMDFLTSLSTRQLQDFVNICLLGDGSKAGSVFYQHDSQRMDAFSVAAVLAGFSPSLDSTGTVCSLRRKRPFTWIKDTPIYQVNYRGTIWCPTLPSGYWVARRHGKVFITGNSNYPPTDADSIVASAPPTISSGVKSEDTTLTGWTTLLTAGSGILPNIDSVTNMTWAKLVLIVERR